MVIDIVKDFYDRLPVRSDQCIGIAFSGGSDSMCLLLSSLAAGVKCVILHCNFHLRAEESNRDAIFAHRQAIKNGVEFLSIDFDATTEAKKTHESIEMACRRLRYEWFELLLNEGKVDYVALGHHQSDNVETFMLNLSRGSGLKGLCGIPQQRGKFIRPLLAVRKADIMQFLQSNNQNFVVDSTNLQNDCQRNIWRNKLIKEIEHEFPNFQQGVSSSINHLNTERRLLYALINDKIAPCISDNGIIDIDKLSNFLTYDLLLGFYLRNKADFRQEVINQILEGYRCKRNGVYQTQTKGVSYQLHRGKLYPIHTTNTSNNTHIINRILVNTGGELLKPIHLTFEVVDKKHFKPNRNANIIWLDYEAIASIAGDIVLRHWRQGDRITPFGMNGSRLVSDEFSDRHLTMSEKNSAWLLVADEIVLWIPGIRCSDHFAVTPNTKHILKITYNSNDVAKHVSTT